MILNNVKGCNADYKNKAWRNRKNPRRWWKWRWMTCEGSVAWLEWIMKALNYWYHQWWNVKEQFKPIDSPTTHTTQHYTLTRTQTITLMTDKKSNRRCRVHLVKLSFSYRSEKKRLRKNDTRQGKVGKREGNNLQFRESAEAVETSWSYSADLVHRQVSVCDAWIVLPEGTTKKYIHVLITLTCSSKSFFM